MAIEIIYPNYNTSLNTNKNTASTSSSALNGNFSDVLNSKISNASTLTLEQIFEKASEKFKIPLNLLKAVAKAESNFDTNAVSSCGAQGIMQLMPETAKGLGVTNSFDAEQNIMGGAKYLGQMLNRFDGDTKLALAAYNAGPGNVLKYGGIPPFKETQNYVNKVIGYYGENISVDTSSVAVGNVSKTYAAGTEKNVQNIESLSLTNENIDIKEYAHMLDLYRYQMQLNILSATESNEE